MSGTSKRLRRPYFGYQNRPMPYCPTPAHAACFQFSRTNPAKPLDGLRRRIAARDSLRFLEGVNEIGGQGILAAP